MNNLYRLLQRNLDRFPVALVTMLGMLAMIYSGVLPFRTAFSNFGSTPVLLTA